MNIGDYQLKLSNLNSLKYDGFSLHFICCWNIILYCIHPPKINVRDILRVLNDTRNLSGIRESRPIQSTELVVFLLTFACTLH